MKRWLEIGRTAVPYALECLTGGLASLLLILCVTPFRLTFGIHLLSDTALLLAVCSIWVLSPASSQGPRIVRSRAGTSSLLIAAVWACLVPAILACARWGFSWATLEAVEQPWFVIPFLLGTALMCVGPAVVAARSTLEQAAGIGRWNRAGWMMGAALACLGAPYALLPVYSSTMLNIAAVVLAGGTMFARSKLSAVPSATTPSTQTAPVVIGSSKKWSVSPVSMLLAGMTGVGLCLSGFFGSQLIARSLASDAAVWLAMIAGVAVFFRQPAGAGRSVTRVMIPTHRPPFVLALTLALWVTLLAGSFSLLVMAALQITSWSSDLLTLQSSRMGLRSLLALPGALCLGWLMSRAEPGERLASKQKIVPALALAGYLLTLWSPFTPSLLVAALGGTALILATDRWLRARWTITPHWSGKVLAGLGACATICLLAVGPIPRAALSDRVLYSPHAFELTRQHAPLSKVAAVDDGRLLAEFESPHDRVSVWRHRGSQSVTRRNGIPLDFVSNNAQISPRSVGDVLPALLPLVMHPGPRNVLVLGAHESSLETCHLSPLASVTMWEGNSAMLQVMRWRGEFERGAWTATDGPERHLHHVDFRLAALARPQQMYDIITLPVLPPVELATAGLIQSDFYRSLRNHLTDDGIFTQRLSYYDLGPQVVRTALSALRSQFEHVMLVESLPGELVCLASRQPLEISESTVQRLAASQYRQLLGEGGWDYAVALGRGGLNDAAFDKFLAGAEFPQSALGWQWPLEVGRWGAKSDRTRAELSAHGSALWSWLGEDSELAKEITQRIEDQAMAHRIQTESPDDPWAYRAALKGRLQDRPRSVIEQVKFEGLQRVMHPDDRRRKDYLAALGPVATSAKPASEDVRSLLRFTQPYDPLVSQFVNYEVSNLLSRGDGAEDSYRLAGLLHTSYFGPGSDRSVRNLSEAMQLLCRQNDMPAAERWDHLNGLMHLMAQRWQLRMGQEKVERYDSQDTAHCVAAVEAALPVMRADAHAAGLSTAEWDARQEVIEETLLRPIQRRRVAQVKKLPRSAAK